MSEVWNAPKKIELLYEKKSSGTFSSINRPTSGSRELMKKCPVAMQMCNFTRHP